MGTIKEKMDSLEAVILAGGFGTRLQHIVSDVPKPMAPMDEAGTPFLQYVLADLARQGIRRVILSTGYKSEVIEQYFGGSFQEMELVYSREDTPLGTGGAVKQALTLCTAPDVFVLNGDTFFDVDLTAMRDFHRAQDADFTLAMKEMFNFDRYGAEV
jgi:D-glycero-alpha-D-manno-heptose 1-phosphate guanylyltransferase